MKSHDKKKEEILGNLFDNEKEKFYEVYPDIAERERSSKEMWKSRKDEKGPIPEKDTLIIARRWGSKAPAMFAERGGGYILFLNGLCIVIDPGYYFKDNLLDLGFSIANIDYIIITHNHPDHTDDLVKLINGIREYKRHVELYTTTLTYEMYNTYIKTNNKYIKYNEINEKSIKIYGSSYDIVFHEAFHKEIPEEPEEDHGAKGLSVVNRETNEVLISITGDTVFKDQLIESHKDAKLLIAHIGSPSSSENHLCFNGTEKLIKGVNPEFAIITEFDMEEFGTLGTRIATANNLQKSTETTIFAGDIGLSIQIEDDFLIKCKCKSCSNEHWIPVDQVEQIELKDELGLRIEYLAKNCSTDFNLI